MSVTLVGPPEIHPSIFVDVLDASDVLQGDGPIVTATSWEYKPGVDRCGTIRFNVPASDPKARLLKARLRVRAYMFVDGQRVELGYGIIGSVTVSLDAPDMLDVTGFDLLREIVEITVGDLVLSQVGNFTPVEVSRTPLVGVAEMLTDAYDGNAGTYATATLSSGWFLYVVSPVSPTSITFTLGSQVNSAAADWEFQYYNAEHGDEGSWDELEITSNGTKVDGCNLGQSGTIEFDAPIGIGLFNGGYAIRMRPMDTSCTVDLVEVVAHADEAVADGLDRILAAVNAGLPAGSQWALDTVDGHAATLGTILWTFAGESGLTALIKVAETLGEHFRLGAGRTIVWLQKDQPASGLRAVYGVDARAAADKDEICLITKLSERRDASSIYSRIYPRGGGTGTKRASLKYTDRTLPAGYVYVNDPADGLPVAIKRTATDAWAGRIDQARESWSDIVALNATPYQALNAANTLCDKAVEWLRTHSCSSADTVPAFYDLTVTKVRQFVRPGETIRVSCQRYRDGQRYIDIEADLQVLAPTQRVDATGVYTVACEIASIDRWPEDDTAATVAALEQAGAARAHPGMPAGATGYGLDGVVTGVVLNDGAVQALRTQRGIADGEHATGGAGGKVTTAKGLILEIVPDGGGAAGALTVEESDGTPSIENVVKIKVPNGWLSGSGGVATIAALLKLMGDVSLSTRPAAGAALVYVQGATQAEDYWTDGTAAGGGGGSHVAHFGMTLPASVIPYGPRNNSGKDWTIKAFNVISDGTCAGTFGTGMSWSHGTGERETNATPNTTWANGTRLPLSGFSQGADGTKLSADFYCEESS